MPLTFNMHLPIALLLLLGAATTALAIPRLLLPGSKSSPPTPLALEEFIASTASDLEIRAEANATKSALPSASVTLCTEVNFKGECASIEWPVNQCIDLRDYAGLTKSFLPGKGYECLLMQNKCDASAPYADIEAKDVAEGSDLTGLDWIKEAESYICFTELKALQRFVRISRLRMKGGNEDDDVV